MLVTKQNGPKQNKKDIKKKSKELWSLILITMHYDISITLKIFSMTLYISSAASVFLQLHCRHAATQFLVYPWWLLLLYHSVSCMTGAVFLDQYYIMSFCAVTESCIKLLDLLLWKCTAETKNGLITICGRGSVWKWKGVPEGSKCVGKQEGSGFEIQDKER